MSEDHTYEFLSLDKPLSAKEQAALRKVSSRAEISATRFYNEYNFGELKADPAKLVERYFDVHLHVASYGDRRLMFRMPITRVDTKRLRGYFPGDVASAHVKGDHLVIDLQSAPDDGYETWGLPENTLGELVPLRAELLRGDMRGAYLAWLYAVQSGEVSEKAIEPEVPRGLKKLTGPQNALADLFAIEQALIDVAAEASEALPDENVALRKWALALSAREKDKWLQRAASEPDLALGGEMLRELRAEAKPVKGSRAAGDLREAAGMARD